MLPETTQEACICFLFLQLRPSCRRVCTAGASASQHVLAGEAHKPLWAPGAHQEPSGEPHLVSEDGMLREGGLVSAVPPCTDEDRKPLPRPSHTGWAPPPTPPGVVGDGGGGPLSGGNPGTRVEGLPAGKGAVQAVLLRPEPSLPARTTGSHAGAEGSQACGSCLDSRAQEPGAPGGGLM